MSTPLAHMFVYDVDGAGGTSVHYVETDGVMAAVAVGDIVYPPGYFSVMKAMHEKCGQTMTLELSNEEGNIWSVRVGKADFGVLLEMVKDAIVTVYQRRGYIGGSNEKTNFSSPFANN